MLGTHRVAIRDLLLNWYDANRRDLPWRVPRGVQADPYRVWISEVMLQQTRVETALPYYERWLRRFPSLEALADAPLDDLLKAWEGLGYYSRARNLHRAVREVRDRHGGHVPADPARFRELPGVGRYTAGAVMSIAFGRAEPVVDGNVRRVFARWLDEPRPSDAGLWELAGSLVVGERPGDLNQALMELGATVCTPRNPSCTECPVAAHCLARARGTQAVRPEARARRALPLERHGVAVIEREGRALLVQRPPEGLLGGLWEFPGGIRLEGESALAAARRVAAGLGVMIHGTADLATVRHAFTHLRVEYHAFRCMADVTRSGVPSGAPHRWLSPAEIGCLALPRAQQKILERWRKVRTTSSPGIHDAASSPE
jgi:A/G-specific adenine glycosylase